MDLLLRIARAGFLCWFVFPLPLILAQQPAPRFRALVDDAKTRIHEINTDDVLRLTAADPPAQLVDVREFDEWQRGHVPGAIHLGKGVLEWKIESVVPDPKTPIILYCGGGNRSALAADSIQRMGYTRVYSVIGGYSSLCQLSSHSAGVFDGRWSQLAQPSAAGWNSEELHRARRFATQMGSDAVLVAHRGNVVVAWGEITRPFKLYSVRKSLLSALIGIHVERGTIDLQATLADLGINDVQPLTDTERSARILDLMRSRSGVYHPAAFEPPGNAAQRPARGAHAPGEHWWYNNWDFNVLATIYNQQGLDLFRQFKSAIADPIGMEDFSLDDTFYWLEPSKSRHPAYLFRLSARDLARFGLLILRKGEWRTSRVIPESWVETSTARHTDLNATAGYGLMWWVVKGDPGAKTSLARFDRVSARGTGGQRLLFIPKNDFVFVHLADWNGRSEIEFEKIDELASVILDAMPRGEKADQTSVGPLRVEPLDNGPLPISIRRTAIEMNDRERTAVLGDYVLPDGDSITLFDYEGRLFLRSNGLEIELFRESPMHFFSPEQPLVVHTEEHDGRIRQLTILFRGTSIVAQRAPNPPPR